MKFARRSHFALAALLASSGGLVAQEAAAPVATPAAAAATTASPATEVAAPTPGPMTPGPMTPGPMTTAEARAAMRQARWPRRAAGFYYRRDERESRGRKTVTESWEWLREDGQRLARTEVRRQRARGKPLELSGITLTTPEGAWKLHERVAIKQSLTQEMSEMQRKALALKDSLAGLQGTAREEELAKLGQLSGVRELRDGRPVVVLTFVYGEKLRELMHDMADDAVDEAKKRVPLLLRPVVSAAIIAKGGIDAQLPVQREVVADAKTLEILRERQLKADGTEIGSRRGSPAAWQRCEPLPLDRFAVPADLERLEAKSLSELIELESKYDQQDRELRAAAVKAQT